MSSTYLTQTAWRILSKLNTRRASEFKPEAFSPDEVEKRELKLDENLMDHLSAFTDLQLLFALGMSNEKLREARELAQDAKYLAIELSLLPDFKAVDLFQEAYDVLVVHGRNSGLNSEIPVRLYRSRLKNAILFLRSKYPNN